MWVFPQAAFSQGFSVTGQVTDAHTKNPLEGVSIAVRGTTNGTISDGNGNFHLTVNQGDSLMISCLGYQSKTVSIQSGSPLAITLTSQSNSLTGVVVIGYGERQKKDVTGAISTVDASQIEHGTAMSPVMALQGNAAGVFIESGGGEPQAKPTVRIRGVNTFGFADPLYVVDGIPIWESTQGSDLSSPINIFTMINPDDIASISVLKDASAAAIYGVRASNGVVLITTKKGTAGAPRVDVTARYGIQQIAKTKPVLNSQQYMDLIQEEYANNPDANTTVGQKFGPLYDPGSPDFVGNAPTYDWQKELIHDDAPMQDYNVRVSGGTDRTTYYFSGGYQKTQSPLKGNWLERYSVAVNVDANISKVVQAGITVRMIDENSLDNTQADLGTMMSSSPFQPFYDKNDPTGFAPVAVGEFEPNPDFDPNSVNPGALYNFAAGYPQLLWGQNTRFNVFAFQALNKTNYNLLSTLGDVYVQVQPLAGLTIKGSLGGQFYYNIRKQWSEYDGWRFSQTPGNPYAGHDGSAAGSYAERQGKTYNLNKNLTVHYNHTFNKDHNIDVIFNASQQTASFYISDLSSPVGDANPQFRSISNKAPYTQGFAGILQEDALLGYVGRLSYKYKDKYYLDATLRYDGSSRLAPGHRWDKFPAVGVAWRISQEDFFPKSNIINDLKLRGGWGKLGNYQSAGYYEYLSRISPTPDYPIGSGNGDPYGVQMQGVVLPNFANTSLGWEKLKTISGGFDALLFNNSLSFTAEYYNKLTYGIIESISLPPNTGIQSQADINIAKVRNSGIELQLTYHHQLGPISFQVSGNLTTVKNEVITLYGGTPLGGETGRIEEGYPMFYLWGYKVGGVFQNSEEIEAWRAKYADLNLGQNPDNPSDGYQYQPGDMYFQDVYGNPTGPKERYDPHPDSLINSNDRTYLGKTIPGYYYGLSINAGFKQFDLTVLFQGVGDVQKYNSVRSGLEAMGGLANQWATTLNRWTDAHPSKDMPRAIYGDPASNGRFSSRFIEDAGYLRLKNIQLGYSLPSGLLKTLGFVHNFRIYVAAVNLFTMTNYTGLDPENDVVPVTRQFLFGLNASF
jgi:TonB-linked SusC/RagA family outer membrane protein